MIIKSKEFNENLKDIDGSAILSSEKVKVETLLEEVKKLDSDLLIVEKL